MKIKFILFSVILLFIPFLKAKSSDFIYFNNLDPKFGGKVYENNFRQYCGPELESVSFEDEVLDKIKITDYKVAIFTLGEYPLSVRTASSKHFVIDKIKTMIDSGKSVMIVAKNALWGEFDPNSQVKHPDVNNFLTNTLGINFIKRMPVHYVSGNTIYYQGYVVRGAPKDPIGKADVRFCNQGYTQGATTYWPLDTILYVDVFKTKDPNKYFPVDIFTRSHPAPLTDTLLGIRTQIGKARIVFWSYGFENIAGNQYVYSLIERALKWLTEGAPQPGAQIESLDENVDFGYVYVGDSSQSTVSFRNIGSEPLIVSSIEIENFSGKNAFSIIDGGNPVTLQSGEVHTVTIKFKPKEKGYYTDFLIIKSNSQTESEKAVNLTGNGDIVSGGFISVSLAENKLDFGKIPAGEKVTRSFDIINSGNLSLNIDSIVISNRDAETIFFGDGITSARIPPGGKKVKEVYFQPKEEKIYNGTLRIYSDALNLPVIDIQLVGEGLAPSEVYSNINNELLFDVITNPSNNKIQVYLNLFDLSNSPAKINVVSSDGKIVYSSQKETFSANENFFEIETDLSSGLYFIMLEIKNKRYTKPVIIIN
ncbi:MAG: choice-of-anchor D domain-containing protein [Candidatus Kapabacteria bacterium]|nr:choice-of-anchor D domain-containing protein [Candidatus Kapabacteria bacterium]